MLIAVIPVDDISVVIHLIHGYEDRVDGFELRWDYAKEIRLEDIESIRAASILPMIFTLRRQDQGGSYLHDEHRRFQDVLKLCEGHPEYLDLEWDVPKKWITMIRQFYTTIKIIGSYHNFVSARAILPDDDFDIIKVATYCHSSLDALHLLHMQMNANRPSIFLGMGTASSFIRPLGPIVGRVFDYASISADKSVAEGQMTVDELLDIYRYRYINQHTRVYGLIGNPVDKSLGHVFHNQVFYENHVNAIYIKIPVKTSEIRNFFELIEPMPFQGLSVTMPLKKEVCSMAEELNSKLGALNTLKRVNEKWVGINTDGEGAIQVIGNKLTNTVLLGAGGAACAIANAIIQKGFKVVSYNRTHYENIGFTILNVLPKNDDYGLIINTLPDKVYQDNPLLLQKIIAWMKPGMMVMDINYQNKGIFLDSVQQLDVYILSGLDMFYAQARLQLKFWNLVN